MGFTEIYERIKLATNCRTQVELAGAAQHPPVQHLGRQAP